MFSICGPKCIAILPCHGILTNESLLCHIVIVYFCFESWNLGSFRTEDSFKCLRETLWATSFKHYEIH